ncbi:MAG: GrpB family protein [Chloroflexi bacterium]|nr:GrpB family protein [Chloroflexota bacterium]
MPEPIIIVDYNPEWPREYEKTAARIFGTIGDKVVAVEHIGSTAVPGLGAKPIIDIIVAVGVISDAHKCITPLRSIGYEYTPYPDFPERLFFRDGPMGEGPHHLHVTEFTSSFWEEKLLFRDFLRARAEVAQEYFNLKIQLAARYGADREEYEPYTEAKTSFIESVVARARAEKQSS